MIRPEADLPHDHEAERLIVINSVMPDFMSGIHDLKTIFISKSWMAGASPAMTGFVLAFHLLNPAQA
jgi:hypothetical protein